MIKKIDFSNMIATQYLQYLVRFAQIVSDSDPVKLKVIRLLTPLNDYIVRLSRAIKQEKGYQETQDIKLSDQ